MRSCLSRDVADATDTGMLPMDILHGAGTNNAKYQLPLPLRHRSARKYCVRPSTDLREALTTQRKPTTGPSVAVSSVHNFTMAPRAPGYRRAIIVALGQLRIRASTLTLGLVVTPHASVLVGAPSTDRLSEKAEAIAAYYMYLLRSSYVATSLVGTVN